MTEKHREEGAKDYIELPSILPVLPVRNTVLFPNAAVPLIVGRRKSVRSIKEAQKQGEVLLVVSQRDGSREDPSHEELYNVGVVCLISKVTRLERRSYQLIANGLFRFKISKFQEVDGYLGAVGEQLSEIVPDNAARVDTLAEQVKQLGKSILELAAIPGSEALTKLFDQVHEGSQIADLCCTFLQIPMAKKQELLETLNLENRLGALLDLMLREKEKLILQSEIQSKMMDRLSKDQRDHLLREQLRTIHDELGDGGNVQEEYAKKIEEAGLSSEAKKIAKEEYNRLVSVPRSSPEYHVIRTYLDWLCALPWKKTSAKKGKDISLDHARRVLDEEHYGIEKVKKRILEFLSVTKLKKDHKGPILCLVGPPGVGKTSICRSIAKAIGRNFARTSLGGMRDEAEIRGHRRTYVGALPGRVIQNLKRSGTKDPLFVLDEIDKIGMDFRGDPASALLEVLDPEQNNQFLDHYIDVPFDLSKVFFITTANVVETIPSALKDRLEIIEMTSYSKREKLEIAKRHLVPKALKDHGIKSTQLEFDDSILETVIDDYTHEAGVRNLTREIAHICRAAAMELACDSPPNKVLLSTKKVEEILGPKKFFKDVVENHNKPGVITGLAWTPYGGEILTIEATRMEGTGKIHLTGKLGEVMKESAQIALSLLRACWGKELPFSIEKSDFHIHVPSGAIPKDGPSAGVAMFLALSTLTEKQPVPAEIAVTGEITLRGSILPVGGIKEKVLAAHRAGVKTVYLPARNQGDLKDVSPDVRKQLKFHFMNDIQDVFSDMGLSPKIPKSFEIQNVEGHA